MWIFLFPLFIHLILTQSNHFNLRLELVPKHPPQKTRTVLYFLLNSVISLCIIQRIKKMLGNYSWQDLLKN